MTILDRIDHALTHPLTVVSTAVSLVASIVHVPVVSAAVSTAWHQAGTLFAAVSVSATQGWLPPETGEAAVLVVGMLFLARMLDKLWDGLNRRLEK